ncbi:hypothetical protein BST95_11595 [Halioglobus japonicus]|uniref:Uncharacterized protein n=1 Tax=Halioglobus japonicus TaxID=930805 RepID=A0AAP8MFC5_9GAMM|nr:hypothetical protein [Halioglobus japonicus]AQA18785.1 hypothetical protein BST95_11595 [Halioglobus japonicus]PLW86816.1 hypothetical protein C0029_10590 [Halioglobus japonicus]GHD10918.1 hypothetical protein GCM10007052_10070 [Halioglobus japonicus]
MNETPRPSRLAAILVLGAVLAAMAVTGWQLLSIPDSFEIKRLIEDAGPVQLAGQSAIFTAFGLACLFALLDRERRVAYVQLSYLLMFYALREADYHYELSDHAKATQFKRFFSHEMIPLSTKLFLAAIVILFLVVMYRYLKAQLPVFLRSLRVQLPWAIFAFAWAVVFFLSQAIDQIPVFHNVTGQVFEEIFESGAEFLVLIAMILFRLQVDLDKVAGAGSRL